MAEEIKAVLTADSSALQAELAKALAALAAYQTKASKQKDAGLPGLQITPENLRQLDQAAARSGELARQTQAAGRAGSQAGMGFLQLSYAIQDVQYGFRGVINNLPMIAQGFGGGAGLAGGMMLAAIAGNLLWPQIQKIYGSLDVDKLKQSAEEWAKIFNEGNKAAMALGEEANSASRMADMAVRLNESYQQRLALLGQMTNAYDEQLDAQKNERSVALEILAARKQMMASLGGDTKPYVVKKQAIESQGVSSDLKNREEAMKSLAYENTRLSEVRSNLSAENTDRDIADTKRLVEAKKNLAAAEANLAQVKINRANSTGKEKTAYADSEFKATKNVERIKAEIVALTEVRKVNKEAGDAALKQAEEGLNAMDRKINKTHQEIEALKILKAKIEELHKIERQQVAIDEAKQKISTLKTEQPRLEKALETARQQQQVTGTISDDIAVMRETVQHGRKKGQALKEKIDMEKEAAQLARDGGLTGNEARALLKERKDLAEEIAKIPTGSISERRQARTEERDKKREDARNEKVAEAQRLREARGHDGKPIDPNKGRENLDKINQRLEDARAKAAEELGKNIKKQTELQEKIEKAISAITRV